MNILKVFTKPETAGSHLVYWTNTDIAMRGVLRVTVPAHMKFGMVAAELYALQYLLEVKEVVGNNTAGNKDIKLIVSDSSIKELAEKKSDKGALAPYANFLTTRYKDSPIEVAYICGWIDETITPSETLDASQPMDEKITVFGAGEVILTSHAVEQFYERIIIPGYMIRLNKLKAGAGEGEFTPPEPPTFGDAWRKLRKIAAEKKVSEFEKDSKYTRMKYAMSGSEEGRYFEHKTQGVILVVGKTGKGKPALLTAYPKVYFK